MKELGKSLKILLVCMFVGVASLAMSQVNVKAFNVYKYHNIKTSLTSSCRNSHGARWDWPILQFIPLYGIPNATLTLNIYSAAEYYGRYNKATEYPEKQYSVVYDSYGRLWAVEEGGSNIRSIFSYGNDGVLSSREEYNSLTGEHLKSYYFSGEPFEYNGLGDFDKYGYSCAVAEEWVRKHEVQPLLVRYPVNEGYEIYFSAYMATNDGYRCMYLKHLFIPSSNMRARYSLAWASKSRKYAKEILMWEGYDLYKYPNNYNAAGLSVDLVGNVSAAQLGSVTSNGKYYEYVWNYSW